MIPLSCKKWGYLEKKKLMAPKPLLPMEASAQVHRTIIGINRRSL